VNRLLDKIERRSFDDAEFRDPWLRTVKEIVELGPDAIPDLIEELDATQDPRMLQILGLMLQAIDDTRAVPALIRAIPRTFQLPSPEPKRQHFVNSPSQTRWNQPVKNVSEKIGTYDAECERIRSDGPGSLYSRDPELVAFLHEVFNKKQERSENTPPSDGPEIFGFRRPDEKICEALNSLTGARNGEFELKNAAFWDQSNSASQIRRKRQLFQHVAQDWAAWWEQNWSDFTDDKEFSRVGLKPLNKEDAAAPDPNEPVDRNFRWTSFVLESVLDPKSKRVFYDMDTGRSAPLPDKWRTTNDIKSQLDEIVEWAEGEGFDLMGTEYIWPETGRVVVALQPIGLEAEEMQYKGNESYPGWTSKTPSEGPLLSHDRETGAFEPTKRAMFHYVTSKGASGHLFVDQSERPEPDSALSGDPDSSSSVSVKCRKFSFDRTPRR